MDLQTIVVLSSFKYLSISRFSYSSITLVKKNKFGFLALYVLRKHALAQKSLRPYLGSCIFFTGLNIGLIGS